nr:NADH-quinone oxidoreductase subunit J [Fodinicola feengrottensis]
MGTVETVLFFIIGPVALIGAIGMVLARNAVHSALFLVLTMASLGVFYLIQAGPFIGMVQIIVYTGAIMTLFLFVLMLIGRDSSDSVVETLRGQKVAATVIDRHRPRGPAGQRVAARPRLGQGGRAGQPERQRAERERVGQPDFFQVCLRFRGHLGAADHRRGRRDHPRAHPARAG